MRRNFFAKFKKICMERHVGTHQGGWKPAETSVTEFWGNFLSIYGTFPILKQTLLSRFSKIDFHGIFNVLYRLRHFCFNLFSYFFLFFLIFSVSPVAANCAREIQYRFSVKVSLAIFTCMPIFFIIYLFVPL